MIAAKEHFPKFTPEEYFAWEEQQEVKHVYFAVKVFVFYFLLLFPGKVFFRSKSWEMFFCCNHLSNLLSIELRVTILYGCSLMI